MQGPAFSIYRFASNVYCKHPSELYCPPAANATKTAVGPGPAEQTEPKPRREERLWTDGGLRSAVRTYFRIASSVAFVPLCLCQTNMRQSGAPNLSLEERLDVKSGFLLGLLFSRTVKTGLLLFWCFFHRSVRSDSRKPEYKRLWSGPNGPNRPEELMKLHRNR